MPNKQYKTVADRLLLNLKRLIRQPFHIAIVRQYKATCRKCEKSGIRVIIQEERHGRTNNIQPELIFI